MRTIAEKNVSCDSIAFSKGVSNETNLPEDYADIITVSQAFHWMDIDSSLAEFYRILKPGGVLAIYDFALPPIIDWEIEKAFLALRNKCSEIWYSQEAPPVHNDKKSYVDRIKSFGRFRYSREVECHGVEKWSAQKAMAFLVNISNADFAVNIDDSIKRDVDKFLDLVKTKCGSEFEIIFPYAMLIAVK
jgi:ubiquinone/menaquinone biosynthesis C-methylase UbiE